MPVGHDDVAVRRDRACGGTDERISAGFRDAGLAQRQQHFSVWAELEQLKSTALRRGVVHEGSAVACPEIAVVVLTESVRLHEHPVAETPIDRARGIDVENRRL